MLFRNENSVLGPSSQINEFGTLSTNSTLVSNNFKPVSREMLEIQFSATINAGANLSGYVYLAPWACQVVGVRYNCTVAAGAGVLSIEKINADSVAPAAANGTTIVLLTAATMTLSGFTANTRQNPALSTASGALLLNAGDQIAFFLSAVPTSLVGGNVQVELVQLG